MKNQKIQQVVTRIKGTFNGFTRGQRAVTIIAVIVAIVGGVIFYNWASKPTMSPLFSGLSSSDASAITAKLTENGTEYQLEDNGATVLVPRDVVDQTRIDLAGEGLPKDTDSSGGYSLVSEAPMTASDSQQRTLLKQATEGELRKAIEKIDTVQEANVQLALPEPDVFTREQAKTEASVMVSPKPDQEISGGQVEAITHLVSSSIPKLDPSNVTVTDSAGQLLSAGGMAGGAAAGEQRAAQQQAVNTQVTQAVQTMLDKAVGQGNSSVQVQAELGYDNTQVTSNEYIQPQAGAPPLQTDNSQEQMTGTGQTPVGGVLGPDNIPVPQAGAAGGNSNYQKETTKDINPYGTRQTITQPAQGAVKRLNVAVMLDARKAAAVNQGAIQQMACTAAGVDTTRGDVCTVAKVPFDTQAAQQQQAEADALAQQQRRDEIIDIVKNVGLALLLLLALLIGFRKSRKKTRTVEIDELESGPALPELPGGSGATAALEGPPSEYALDDGDDMRVLEATPVDPQSQARLEARDEISHLVEENPDEVARLLRGWMAERK